MNQKDWHKLISGQEAGLAAVLLRLPLGIAACAYSAIVRLRNFLYSKNWLKAHRANAIVLSIGNITVGGTGKTPLVIWLCKFLQQQRISCAILTRGYKTNAQIQAMIDEPAILTESCPQAKLIVNPNRVESANEAVSRFDSKVLVMDDGFQHHSLHRNLDIVTIDATRAFGYGKLLPAGLLREPVSSLRRADAVVVTRCDQTSKSELSRIEKELQRINPDMVIAESIHSPICAKTATGEEIAIEQLKGKKIFAFCGIANPDAFLSTIKNIEGNLVGSKIYDDHYHYNDSDINDIHDRANQLGADLVLSTQKDYTHYMAITTRYAIPFAYLAVEIKFTSREDELKQLIKDVLGGKIHKNCR